MSVSAIPNPAKFRRVAMVVAHPDDEAIGAGGHLAAMADLTFIHVTGGAPRSTPNREELAARRRQELLEAAAIAGVPAERCLEIGIVDQEASFQMVALTTRLIQLFAQLDPDIVLTHAYEGGHPDHDAVAFSVNHARRFLARRSTRFPAAVEFACYHRNPGGENMETACFLPVSGIEPVIVPLSEAQQARKQQMFSCYSSQREILAQFPLHVEAFRIAPAYDFAHPPHPGPLFYEGFDWGISGIQWRKLATRAEEQLAA
jgi:LmbE family N-acetylglucosaminyl deacetylase